MDDYAWWKMILLSGIPCTSPLVKVMEWGLLRLTSLDILWQAAYYKFISIDRKSKVESGERQNSFHL